MKIVNPSCEIIEEELAALSIYQRIDKCGSICYQRAEKPTDEEAQEFCRSMVKRRHLTTLEMAQIHLVIVSDLDVFDNDNEYISKSFLHGDSRFVLMSGSIRAFMEMKNIHAEIQNFLAEEYPIFFSKVPYSMPLDLVIRFARPEDVKSSHKYVAVKVVCSRSISHQLVRHRPFSFLQESQRYCRYEDGVTFIRPEWYDDTSTTVLKMRSWNWTSHMAECEDYYKRQLEQFGLSPQQARGGLPNDTKTELIMYGSLPMWDHVFELRCAAGADPECRRIMIPLQKEFVERYGNGEQK